MTWLKEKVALRDITAGAPVTMQAHTPFGFWVEVLLRSRRSRAVAAPTAAGSSSSTASRHEQRSTRPPPSSLLVCWSRIAHSGSGISPHWQAVQVYVLEQEPTTTLLTVNCSCGAISRLRVAS